MSWIGIWLLVLSAVAIVFELVVAGIWSLRVARRSRELSQRLATETALVQADLARLRLALAEARLLWRPYRRVLRWTRHPLTIALLESYARRKVRV
ncbi:MAG: hypothetical protein ACREOM_04545 [Candidatus Dormibacteraceae bacterium]